MGRTPEAVTALALSILRELGQDISQPRTIRQIATRLRKAYPNVHATVQHLLDEGMLFKNVVGHSHDCRLNLENSKTCLALALAHATTLKKPTRAVQQLLANNDVSRISMIWEVDGVLLVIAKPDETPQDNWLSEREFLRDARFITVGRGTLHYGHTRYALMLESYAGVRR